MKKHTRLAGALILAAGASTAGAAEITLHKATYTLTLTEPPGIDGNGRMEIAWHEDCDGTSVELHSDLQITDDEGTIHRIIGTDRSWESHDGLLLRFETHFTDGTGNAEITEGTALLQEDGSKGSAEYSLPEQRKIVLPPGTLFPISHERHILADIERGEAQTSYTVFTTEWESPLERITSSFGTPIQRPNDHAMWHPLHLLFTPLTGNGERYEMTALTRTDGIVDNITMEIEGMRIKGRLESLEETELPSCGKEA